MLREIETKGDGCMYVRIENIRREYDCESGHGQNAHRDEKLGKENRS